MIKIIENAICSTLDIHHITISDDSEKHANHKKDSYGGHYNAIIVSNDFIGKSLIERHRMIYSILGNMMKTKIHAFSMKVLTIEEFNLDD